ncbi:hypothetical protein [Streptomyces purpurascens]|uniref:5'-3' exonuclease alpha-helical arch N-terminal domain-containing protein n=2 Tax=Streptomyces purpurascens TaxID=1924 RepID=A0ABZ1MY96_STREF
MRAEGFEVLIVTGDRDSFQLVSEHTTVLCPTRRRPGSPSGR